MLNTTYSFTIGDFTAWIFYDGALTNQAERVFYGADESQLAQALANYNLKADAIPAQFNHLYLDTGKHQILIDTGVGETDDPKFGFLSANLASVGVDVNDIDIVINTHAHSDHISGNITAEGIPRFPNARYIISQTEWDTWTHPDKLTEDNHHVPTVKSCLLGIQDCFEFLTTECEIAKGVHILATPGHTAGHISVHIQSKDEHFLYLADTFVHPIHIYHPEWTYHSDVNREQSVTSRHKLLNLAIEHQALVTAYHFEFPALGYIKQHYKKFYWQPIT